MNNNIDDFEEIRAKGEDIYKSFTEMYCPYFKEKILFNSQGLEHLCFRSRGKARPKQDQYMRFRLIHLAPLIIRASSTLQGIWETKQFVPIKMGSRWEHVFKDVAYYELIALVKRDRVKIVIKQVENGQKIFWSLIPFWGMSNNTKSRVFHEGSPDID